MNNGFLRTCLCATPSLLVLGQMAAQSYFQRVYGGFANESIFCAAATADSGMVAGGYTLSFVSGSNNADMLMLKCDKHGNMQWCKHYDLGFVGNAGSITTLPDGGLLVTGTNDHIVGVALKLDGSGTPVWGRRNNSVDTYRASSIGNDSSLFIAGETNGGNSDMIVDKLAWDGSPLWSVRYGTNYDEEANGIVATLDGGALIAGGALVTEPESDGLLLKLDVAGNVEWCKTYGLPAVCDVLHDVVECPNGGFIAVGAGCYSTTWPLIVRTDALGDTLWTRRLSDNLGRATSVSVTDYGYLISGNSTSASHGIFMVAMDDMGNILWDKHTNEYENENGAAVVLADERTAIVGDILDAGIGLWDVLISTFSSTGPGAGCNEVSEGLTTIPTVWQLGTVGALLTPTVSTGGMANAYDCNFLQQTLCATSVGIAQVASAPCSAFPNPTSGTMTVEHPTAGALTITDATGRVVLTTAPSGLSTTTPIDLSAFAPGIYLLHTRTGPQNAQVLRIVKE